MVKKYISILNSHLSYTQTTFVSEHTAKTADIRLQNKNQTKTEQEKR